MAQRTDNELKVFLEGTLAQYNALTDTDKAGSVFFDKTNHAVYAKGECIIQSNIKDVTYNSTTTELTITPFTGTPIVINLGIQSELEALKTTLETWAGNRFVRYDVNNQGLTDTQKDNARTNIGAVKAEEGKGLSTNDYTDNDKAKLAGIDENAQTNREVTVNGSPIGRDNEENQSTIRISGNLVDAPNNGEDSKIEFNLSHQYYPTENKIRFFKTATPPATYDETLHKNDVVLTIDTTDFVLAGMITNVEYSPEDEWLEITFPIINQTTGERENKTVEVSLSALIDSYLAGDGLSLDSKTKTFSANLGNGLQFDSSSPKKITLKPATNSGLNVTTNGLAINAGYGLDIDDNNEIFVDIDTDNGLKWTAEGRFGVDFTKAPVQSVNGQTGAVNIDVTPKVWSF